MARTTALVTRCCGDSRADLWRIPRLESAGSIRRVIYSFEGDPDSVPVAPEWLLAEMKAAKTPETFIKNRTALDLSDRTEDEVAVIITECLDVIENRGAGNRDHWVKVGMAIHSVLPNDLGLELWSAWSAKDVEFAEEWSRGNPCEQPWNSFKPGRIGLGSLIYMADRVDPKRTRMATGNSQADP